MTDDIIVSPSILSADFGCLASEIEKTFNFGAKWCHVDVMDGHFVPNITIGAPVVKSLCGKVSPKLDVHLMIENPLKYIPDFINAGSDIITFHIEAAGDSALDCINLIKEAGLKAGVSIKPKTPASAVKELIPFLDMVLVMTVEPGFSGQKFMAEAAVKIKEVKQIAANSNRDLIIQVDGGVNDETGKICVEYGANSLVAGNYVYKNPDMQAAIESLLSLR